MVISVSYNFKRVTCTTGSCT